MHNKFNLLEMIISTENYMVVIFYLNNNLFFSIIIIIAHDEVQLQALEESFTN